MAEQVRAEDVWPPAAPRGAGAAGGRPCPPAV